MFDLHVNNSSQRSVFHEECALICSLTLNVPFSKGKSFTSIEQTDVESFCFAPTFLYVLRPTINYLNERSVSSETILLGINVLIFILTPWSRVILEKLTGSEASQEIPRIFGTRRFITVLTSARHLSLS